MDPTGHGAFEQWLASKIQSTSVNLAGRQSGTTWGQAVNLAANTAIQATGEAIWFGEKARVAAVNLVVPGGVDYWSENGVSGQAGPYRDNQRRALNQAANQHLGRLERGMNAAAAVLSTPAVVIEEMAVVPVMQVPGQSAAVGVHLAQAENTNDPVEKVAHYLEATREASSAAATMLGVATGAQGLAQGLRRGSFAGVERQPVDTADLAARADEFHSALDPIAQSRRTTSALDAVDASGESSPNHRWWET